MIARAVACAAVLLACVAFDAQARFVSVDPVPATTQAFSRVAYARNNPYRYFDPDGRVAIVVHGRNGDVTVRYPTRFHGPAASADNIVRMHDAIAALSGTYRIDGRDTRVTFEIVPIRIGTPMRARNEVLLVEGRTPTGDGRSNAEIGGRRAEIDVTHAFHANGVPAHEFGHLGGLRDLYDPATRRPDPKHGDHLMNRVPGRVDAAFVEALLNAPTNIKLRER